VATRRIPDTYKPKPNPYLNTNLNPNPNPTSVLRKDSCRLYLDGVNVHLLLKWLCIHVRKQIHAQSRESSKESS